MTETKPILTFSIELTGTSSQNCWHETAYRLRQLNFEFTDNQIRKLDLCGMLGYGQELDFDCASQTKSTEDGMNYWWTMSAKRTCDSSD